MKHCIRTIPLLVFHGNLLEFEDLCGQKEWVIMDRDLARDDKESITFLH